MTGAFSVPTLTLTLTLILTILTITIALFKNWLQYRWNVHRGDSVRRRYCIDGSVGSRHACYVAYCETYSKDFLVRFDTSKSKCIVCTPQHKSWSSELNKHVLFTLDGSAIENVSSWPHLRHIICSNCDDNYDIIDRSHKLAGRINNVVCTFSHLDSIVRTRLLKQITIFVCTGASYETSRILLLISCVRFGVLGYTA